MIKSKYFPSQVEAKDNETKRLQEEVEAARRKEEELRQQQIANATKGHLEENDHNEDDELVNGDVSKDLSTDENIVDPIEDRRTLAERNERLQDQLQVGRIRKIYIKKLLLLYDLKDTHPCLGSQGLKN